ncbi:unnamed protein product [Rotaria sp. Silwood2]|nr:unnamed protein product [Rotaria sp. Silwood2]
MFPTRTYYRPLSRFDIYKLALIDESTIEYQRSAWERLKKSINSKINKVNTSNLPSIIRELFNNNIIRGRGLLAHNIIRAQIASPFYTPVYAALVSVINTILPEIGELIAKHLISSFHHTYEQNDKINCLSTIKFIGHFINQNILHSLVALEMLVVLLENPTDDSVELAIEFLNICVEKLSQVSLHGLDSVFSTLNNLLNESSLNECTLHIIEVLFAIRKDQFKVNPMIQPGLDLVDESDQHTHIITLDDPCEPEPMLNIFRYDDQYEENENEYEEFRRKIISESYGDKQERQQRQIKIIDLTETNLVEHQCTVYRTIQSNTNVEECAQKLINMNLHSGQEIELCQMIVDICAQQRTYEHVFGLLGQHFCLSRKEYVEYFEKIFQDQYKIIDYLEYVKLRKVAKFFAHLLVTDAISCAVDVELVVRNSCN